MKRLKVALVSCVKSKRKSAAEAQDLYTSSLFKSMRRYAESAADDWYILSAEYGVLNPNSVVEPYERTLNSMRKHDRDGWAEGVQARLLDVLPAGADVIILAGERYREAIVPFLNSNGFQVSVPMEGLRFGEQLRWLKAHA